MQERIFAGVFPCGISYADKEREKDGDFARLAFLYFASLELRFEKDCPASLRPEIEADAATIQARRGEHYQTSTTGQTVLLGSELPTPTFPSGKVTTDSTRRVWAKAE